MRSKRLARRTAWLAIFAMLLSALTPAIIHALLVPQGTAQSLCIERGVEPLASPIGDGEAPATPERRDTHHCPCCSPDATSAALPSADSGAPHPYALSTSPPPLQLHAPRPFLAWQAARPRAPPAAS